ncbi:hypothetical protein SUDANB19_03532 [Streptomyces sp. enrichment culture]
MPFGFCPTTCSTCPVPDAGQNDRTAAVGGGRRNTLSAWPSSVRTGRGLCRPFTPAVPRLRARVRLPSPAPMRTPGSGLGGCCPLPDRRSASASSDLVPTVSCRRVGKSRWPQAAAGSFGRPDRGAPARWRRQSERWGLPGVRWAQDTGGEADGGGVVRGRSGGEERSAEGASVTGCAAAAGAGARTGTGAGGVVRGALRGRGGQRAGGLGGGSGGRTGSRSPGPRWPPSRRSAGCGPRPSRRTGPSRRRGTSCPSRGTTASAGCVIRHRK